MLFDFAPSCAYFYLQDADIVGSDFLGQAVIPVSSILGGQVLDTWLELTDTSGNVRYHHEIDGDKKPSRVHITIQFVPVEAEVSNLGGGDIGREAAQRGWPHAGSSSSSSTMAR